MNIYIYIVNIGTLSTLIGVRVPQWAVRHTTSIGVLGSIEEYPDRGKKTSIEAGLDLRNLRKPRSRQGILPGNLDRGSKKFTLTSIKAQ